MLRITGNMSQVAAVGLAVLMAVLSTAQGKKENTVYLYMRPLLPCRLMISDPDPYFPVKLLICYMYM